MRARRSVILARMNLVNAELAQHELDLKLQCIVQAQPVDSADGHKRHQRPIA
jgi:hypothetical protein